MGRGWEATTKRDILDLLPSDGSKIRSKNVYAKAKGKHGFETVEKYLKILEEEGSVNKTIENPKSIWYNRCEVARLKHLIDEFMQEITVSLKEIPEEMRAVEKKLIEGSSPNSEVEKGIEVLRSEEKFLKAHVINTLYRKVCGMLKANLPPEMRDRDYYIGYFGDSLYFFPRDVVEERKISRHAHA